MKRLAYCASCLGLACNVKITDSGKYRHFVGLVTGDYHPLVSRSLIYLRSYTFTQPDYVHSINPQTSNLFAPLKQTPET
jgi:hypothetical protein